MGAQIGPNLVHDSILKSKKGPNSYIKLTVDPMEFTENVKKLEDTANGFILTLLFALGFSFIPSSMILFIIREREYNAKH